MGSLAAGDEQLFQILHQQLIELKLVYSNLLTRHPYYSAHYFLEGYTCIKPLGNVVSVEIHNVNIIRAIAQSSL